MISATPNISVRLAGYDVTLNADIEDSEGGSESQGKGWGNEFTQGLGTTHTINWEIGAEVKGKFGAEAGAEVTGHLNLGGEHSIEATWGWTTSLEGSSEVEVNWSTAISKNPTQAAVIALKLKAYNTGTACASNVVPTMTLSIGGHQVTTLNPNTQINALPPNAVYPAAEGVYWVIDKTAEGEPIYLTDKELKAIETGAPISIHITQISADVAAMNEDGYWEYVGDWGEYMARVDAVCTHLYLDPGDGNALSYLVYSDDDPSSPTVTARDAFLWSGGYEGQNGFGIDTILMPYRLPNGTWDEIDLMDCKWYVDQHFADQVPGNLETPPPGEFNFMDIELSPNSYIIGKAPPQPPLDKPRIHWAVYDVANERLYASVSDYFAVEEVWLDGFNYGGDKDFMVEYDDTAGCYVAHLPGFLNEEGQDFIKASNVVGAEADPFPVLELAEFSVPPDPDPYPTIVSSSVSLIETATSLSIQVLANVNTGGLHDIVGVYLLNNNNTYLCQLSGPPGGGSFSYNADPVTFQIDQTEKILVINQGGYQAEEPVGSITVPNAKWISNQLLNCPFATGWWHLDLDTNTNHGYPRQEQDDIAVWITLFPLLVESQLLMPGVVEWMLIHDFPHPSREFIEELTLAQTPDKILTDPVWTTSFWEYDSLVFKTTEGRYGYITGVEIGPTQLQCYLTVFSLWEG